MNIKDFDEPGKIVVVGNKMYARCSDCGKIVCLNKPIVGSMHVCLPDEEKPK